MKKEPQPMEIRNMRGFDKVYMITVLEGKGTEQSIARLVRYIYLESGELVGEIDPVNP